MSHSLTASQFTPVISTSHIQSEPSVRLSERHVQLRIIVPLIPYHPIIPITPLSIVPPCVVPVPLITDSATLQQPLQPRRRFVFDMDAPRQFTRNVTGGSNKPQQHLSQIHGIDWPIVNFAHTSPVQHVCHTRIVPIPNHTTSTINVYTAKRENIKVVDSIVISKSTLSNSVLHSDAIVVQSSTDAYPIQNPELAKSGGSTRHLLNFKPDSADVRHMYTTGTLSNGVLVHPKHGPSNDGGSSETKFTDDGVWKSCLACFVGVLNNGFHTTENCTP